MRLFLAIKTFFKIIFNGEFAQELRKLEASKSEETPQKLPPAEQKKAPAVLLSLLQREARLLDFIKEDIKDFSDAQIGAAVRPVHDGCRQVLDKYVKLEAIAKSPEGSTIEVKEGFDPSEIQLSGKVKGDPPFKGVLQHHGWRIAEMDLPSRPESHKAEVITPAEVELS